MKKVPGFLDQKNSEHLALWRWRWHLQGGSTHWAARPLQDLRNEEGLARYRDIELKRKYLRRPLSRKIVNLARERLERVRRKAKRAI